jgi:hypothetical protein
MAEPSYLEIIKQYPLPTDEQTRAFAEYVAGAHSWYKHLPAYPPMSFDFYLDPNAGRSTIISEDGEIRFEDIVDEGTRFHYTWQLTETYRERLGYWNYLAPYGTHFLIPRGQDVIDTRQSGDTRERPAILVPEVGWIGLPDSLVQAGRADVSALVHEARDVGIYWALEVEGRTAKRVYLAEFIQRHPDALAPDLGAALVKCATRMLHREFSVTDFREERRFRENEVYPLLDRERERQITGMETAMRRFLRALSG